MRDFEKLVKKLRYCSKPGNCNLQCPRFSFAEDCLGKLTTDAADAIEELLAKDKNVPDKNVGEWIAVQSNGERFFRCSRCGAFLKESFFNLGYSVNYCPNCGAAMMEVINDA